MRSWSVRTAVSAVGLGLVLAGLQGVSPAAASAPTGVTAATVGTHSLTPAAVSAKKKKSSAAAKAAKAAKKAAKLARYCAKKKNAKKKKCRAFVSPSAPVTTATGGVRHITPDSPVIGKMAKYNTLNPYTKHYYLLRSHVESFEAAGGGTLVIGAGEYRISSTIYVPSNTTIQLAEGARLVKTDKTGTTKFSASSSIFMLIRPSLGKKKGAVGGHNGEANINIVGAGPGKSFIDMNNVKDALAIIAGHNQRVTISGITFSRMNNNHFIEMDACASCVIENNQFLDSAAGTRDTAEAINLDTPDPKTGGFGSVWSNLDSTPNEDVAITGNLFADLPRSVGTHNFSPGKYHRNIVVRGNTIRNMKDNSPQPGAMVIMNWRDAVITGNSISGNRFGINACGTHNPTISGNSFSDISNQAVRFRICHSGDGNGSTATSEVNPGNLAALRENAADGSVRGPWAEGAGVSQTVYFNGHEPPIPLPDTPNVRVEAGATPDAAVVSWALPYFSNNPRGPVLSYRVYAYLDQAGTQLVPGITNPQAVDASIRSTTFNGLATGAKYYFGVSAVNVTGEGPRSYPAELVLPGLSAAPTDLQVSQTLTGPVITWRSAATVTAPVNSFLVYVYDDAAGTKPTALRGGNPVHTTATTVALADLAASQEPHWLSVAAVNQLGEGPRSVLVQVAPFVPPTLLTAAWSVPEQAVKLTWRAGTVPPQTTGYRVYAYLDEEGTELAPVSGNPAEVNGSAATAFYRLASGTYYFRIRPVGSAGGTVVEGPASEVSEAVVVTNTQSIP